VGEEEYTNLRAPVPSFGGTVSGSLGSQRGALQRLPNVDEPPQRFGRNDGVVPRGGEGGPSDTNIDGSSVSSSGWPQSMSRRLSWKVCSHEVSEAISEMFGLFGRMKALPSTFRSRSRQRGESLCKRPQGATGDRTSALSRRQSALSEPEQEPPLQHVASTRPENKVQVCPVSTVTVCSNAAGASGVEAADELGHSSESNSPRFLQVRYKCVRPADDIFLREVNGRFFVVRTRRDGDADHAGVRPGDELVLISAGEARPLPPEGGIRALVGILPPAVLLFMHSVGKVPAESNLKKGDRSQCEIRRTADVSIGSRFEPCEQEVIFCPPPSLALPLQDSTLQRPDTMRSHTDTAAVMGTPLKANVTKDTNEHFAGVKEPSPVDIGIETCSDVERTYELSKPVLQESLGDLALDSPRLYRNTMNFAAEPGSGPTPSQEDTTVSWSVRGRLRDVSVEPGDDSTDLSTPVVSSSLPRAPGIGGSKGLAKGGASMRRAVSRPEQLKVGGGPGHALSSGRSGDGDKDLSPRDLARSVPRRPLSPLGVAQRQSMVTHSATKSFQAAGPRIGVRPGASASNHARSMMPGQASACPPTPDSGRSAGATHGSPGGGIVSGRTRRGFSQPHHAPTEAGDWDDIE